MALQAEAAAKPEKPEKPRHAITDVYDEERHTFLIQYPIPFIVTLGVSGVVVLALTGFLGYTGRTALADRIFHQPWLLYLWLCALIITLEVSILRHPRLRFQRNVALIVTIISMVIVLITFFYQIPFQNLLNYLLQQLLNLRISIVNFFASNWLYTIINFGVLAIYSLNSALRWYRRSRGLPPNERIDIGLGEQIDTASLPTMQQLVAGDILAGALLCAVLALLFRADVVSLFWHLLRANVHITGCTVSWPIGACTPPGGGLANPPSLTFIDLILTLAILPTGLLILALTAAISGLNALTGIQTNDEQPPVTPASKNESSTQAVSAQVSLTILDTILSALKRWSGSGEAQVNPAEAASQGLLMSLRNILWPPLIFVGVVGAAQFASYGQTYIHSDKSLLNEAQYVGPALLWALVAMICVIFALALLVFHGRVVENTLRFAGLIGFIGLLTLWIYSLALWSFNLLLLKTNASDRQPFNPPAWNTAISLAALLIFGIFYLLRRLREMGNKPSTAGR